MNSNSPKALHLVFNSVREDSRVLKVAWSLANSGWEVLVVGATKTNINDEFYIGRARVLRLPLKIVVKGSLVKNFGRVVRKAKNLTKRFLLIPSKTNSNKFSGIPNLAKALKTLEPVVMQFKPDVIHAHDYTILPVAGRLIEYLEKNGLTSKLIYDAHEYVPGVAHLKPGVREAYILEERKWSKNSAAVLSVSEGMSELLIPHLEINFRPKIVANDPLVDGQIPAKQSMRTQAGLINQEPIMVYSGAVAPQRGLHTAVAALRQMPKVHLVVIVDPSNLTIQKLLAENSDLANRIHVLPYVPNNELVSYLKEADIGLIPLLHRLNHEISLITKFGEYMQARLPILVSDVKTMSDQVKLLGNGEVFIAEDVEDFVKKASLILNQKEKYQKSYTPDILRERSWEKQAENLINIYLEVSGKNTEFVEPAKFELTEPISVRQLF